MGRIGDLVGKLSKATGYLTNEDMEKLEQSGERVLRHVKVFTNKVKCANTECNFEAFYNFVRCPLCEAKRA